MEFQSLIEGTIVVSCVKLDAVNVSIPHRGYDSGDRAGDNTLALSTVSIPHRGYDSKLCRRMWRWKSEFQSLIEGTIVEHFVPRK